MHYCQHTEEGPCGECDKEITLDELPSYIDRLRSSLARAESDKESWRQTAQKHYERFKTWNSAWHERNQEAKAMAERIARLEVMLKDACMKHDDDCKCEACAEVFA